MLQNSLKRIQFFEETFFLADINIKIVLEICFLSLSNTDVKFAELEKLIWRFYTIAKALSTINWVKLINEREFAKIAIDGNSEIFIIYI